MTTAQDQQSRELLPCPFCGREAMMSHSRDGEVCNVRCAGWSVGNCLGAGPNCYTEADAVAGWNRRAPAVQAARTLPARSVDPMLDSPACMEPLCHLRPAAATTPARAWQGWENDGTAEPVYTAAQVQAMGRVPPGWQAVPVELTREMGDAYLKSDGRFHSARSDWAAMLAAAPRPPAAQEPSSTADGASESIRRALHWIDADLRETMRDYLRRMSSDDDFHKSVDRLESILRQGLAKAESAP